MNETMITMSGVVVTDLRKAQARGMSVVSFRMLSTVRRWERGRGWFDADHNFVTVTCWRSLADNVSSSVEKGDPLLVFGRMKVRPYDTADRVGSTVEIDAYAVGHDMNRGTSAFRKNKEIEAERSDGEEGLKQVHWQVEEQSRTAERAVYDARRAKANGSTDLTAVALGHGAVAVPARKDEDDPDRSTEKQSERSADGDEDAERPEEEEAARAASKAGGNGKGVSASTDRVGATV